MTHDDQCVIEQIRSTDRLEARKIELRRCGYVEQPDGSWLGKFYIARIEPNDAGGYSVAYELVETHD
jgi:hypothetical protein